MLLISYGSVMASITNYIVSYKFSVYSMSGHRVVHVAGTHFYSVTKFAVTALTEGVRQELREMKSNCRVTVCIIIQKSLFMISDSLFLLD